MSFNLNATSSTVAITGNLAVGLPSGAVQVIRTVTPASTITNGTFYTVTAGKTLYIQAIWIKCINDQGCMVDADVLGDGTYRQLINGQGNVSGSESRFNVVTFPIPIQVPATKLIRYTNGVNNIATYTFFGYEL